MFDRQKFPQISVRSVFSSWNVEADVASLTSRLPALLQTQIASHTYIITSHITCLSAFRSSLLHYSAFSAPLGFSCPPFLHQPPRLSVSPIPLFPHGACWFFLSLSPLLLFPVISPCPFLSVCLSGSAFSLGRRSSECSVAILTLIDHIRCPLSVSLFGPHWFHQRLFLLVKGLNSFLRLSAFSYRMWSRKKKRKTCLMKPCSSLLDCLNP